MANLNIHIIANSQSIFHPYICLCVHITEKIFLAMMAFTKKLNIYFNETFLYYILQIYIHLYVYVFLQNILRF